MTSKAPIRSAFVCDAVPALKRREVLAGLASLVLAPAALAQDGVRISDLANETGVASGAAKARLGEEIVLRGYFTPAMRAGVLFDLVEKPTALCMCGVFHNAGASIAVAGAERPAGLSMLRAVEVQGVIAVDARGKAQIIARKIVTG